MFEEGPSTIDTFISEKMIISPPIKNCPSKFFAMANFMERNFVLE